MRHLDKGNNDFETWCKDNNRGDLISEWDLEKNGDSRPSDFLPGSNKEVWWRCSKNHSWSKSIKDRVNGSNCPYCTNKRVLAGFNDLATLYPELAKEWDYEKNGGLLPSQVIPGAEKKVWWICSRGHSYNSYVFNRKKGVGCPYCAGKKVLVGFNDLQTLYPQLAKEWDFERNGDIKPTDVLPGSHKRVWWKCSKNHEWEIEIKVRCSGNNCPYCSNKKVLAGYNDLGTTHPKLALEWSKRNKLLPSEIIAGGDKKYYWICPVGHDDYRMTIHQRKRGQGCPKCAQQSQTSFPEQSLFFYIKQAFSDSINRYVIERKEIDIFIPSLKIGLEYDGYYSHKNKLKKDIEKEMFLKGKNIQLIRIKEYKKRGECTNADFYIHEHTTYKSITNLIKDILGYLHVEHNISVDCERDQAKIQEQYIDSMNKNSIAIARPDLVSEWDSQKNGSIKPEYVAKNSTHKYYWICPICHYSYPATPVSRNRGSGCPACAGKCVHPGYNDLQTKCPDILKEWDYDKNRGLDPHSLFYRSKEEVWWKCKNGHSWIKSIESRTKNKSKCPKCQGRKVITGYNDLLTKRPDLAEEWDYELNDITPDKLHYNNQTIYAHWICKKCGHKWTHTVSQRDRCPECQRRKTQINVYDLSDLSFYGRFDNARALCDHLGLDYNTKQQSISNACRRIRKTFLGKFILRYPCDDEFAND